jgi:hypothetical protein
MRFQFNITQLTAKEFLVRFLIQVVQMIWASESLAPNGIADSETYDRQGEQRD